MRPQPTLTAALLLLAAGAGAVTPAANPFAFLAPLVALDQEERGALDAGEPVVRVTGNGDDVVIVTAVRTGVDAERLVAWGRRLDRLQDGRYVAGAGRFSDPPVLSDVAGAELDERDLQALRDCRPGDCGVKLAAEEIAQLRAAVDGGGVAWRARAQDEFRRVLLQRVSAYRAGAADRATYDDDDAPVRLDAEFARLLEAWPFIGAHVLDGRAVDGERSFLYWSRDVYAGRPIISVSHVAVVRPESPGTPEVLVLSRQVFATHYLNAALSVTAITRSGAPGLRYLLYVNRSRVDLLDGPFGSLVRRLLERRVRAEAPALLLALRKRLENLEE